MSRNYAPNRIRELRKAAGYTLEALGAYCLMLKIKACIFVRLR